MMQKDTLQIITALMAPVIAVTLIMAAGFLINTIDRVMMEALTRITGKRAAYIIMNYLTFPGTVIHELSHALMATLTGAKVTEISVFPKGNTLGHVTFTTRGTFILKRLQLCLSSCAPVLAGIATQLLTIYILKGGYMTHPLQKAALLYVDISVLIHASMSKQDIKNYIKGLLIVLPFVWAVTGIYIYRTNS